MVVPSDRPTVGIRLSLAGAAWNLDSSAERRAKTRKGFLMVKIVGYFLSLESNY